MKYLIELIYNIDCVASGFMWIALIATFFLNWEFKNFTISKKTMLFILGASTIINIIIPEKEFLLNLL